MEIITSKNNATIMLAKQLQDKKYRKLQKKCLIEGEKIIEEAIKCGIKICNVFVDCDKTFNIVEKYNLNATKVSGAVIKTLSFTSSPQGIIAVIDTNYKVLSKSTNFLILDNLQNPDNFGAIVRTAVATGFNKIFTINCVDCFNDKVVRASMGTVFKCEIIDISYNDVIALTKDNTIYYADMGGENIFKVNFPFNNVGFVIGNEGNGVSEQIKNIVKNSVSIPMKNNVESLNASIASSVILYQFIAKQN